MKSAVLLSTIVLTSALLLSLRPASAMSDLVIDISDCRDDNNAYLDEVRIIKDGKKFKTVSPGWDGSIEPKNVTPAVYEFRYQSMFGIESAVTIDARKPGSYTDTICVNYFDYSKETYHPVIDRMRAQEKYTIYYQSQGCFHFTEDSLLISRDDKNYSVEYSGERKPLDSSQVELVRRFEWELNHMDNGGCTTTDEYKIVYNGHTMKHVRDGSCDWYGFRHLLLDLGFKDE